MTIDGADNRPHLHAWQAPEPVCLVAKLFLGQGGMLVCGHWAATKFSVDASVCLLYTCVCLAGSGFGSASAAAQASVIVNATAQAFATAVAQAAAGEFPRGCPYSSTSIATQASFIGGPDIL